jgi:hypothetical protein
MSAELLDLTQEEIDAQLLHYGVSGMKWGVRRSPAQLTRARKGQTRFREKGVRLTDAELAARIKRLETEKRYNDLNKGTVGTGRKHVNEVLVKIGKNTAETVGTKAGVYLARKAIDKKFGTKVEDTIFGKNKKLRGEDNAD